MNNNLPKAIPVSVTKFYKAAELLKGLCTDIQRGRRLTKGLFSLRDSLLDFVWGLTLCCWSMTEQPAAAAVGFVCHSVNPPRTVAPDMVEEVMYAWWDDEQRDW